MKVFSKLFGRMRSAAKTGKGLAISAAVFLALTAVGFGVVSASTSGGKVDAASCSTDKNSIIPCGETSRTNFINAVKASKELQNVYAYNYGVPGYGLTQADYNRFITDAQPGIAYSTNGTYGDNTIVVNNRVVATGAWSTGRLKAYQGNAATIKTVVIPNAGTYYGNVNTQSFASTTKAIPVDVLFNPTNGQMQFAVMTSVCGNPAIGTPVKPVFSCNALQPKKVSDNVYSFTTSATVNTGATINKLVYDFGDGTPTVTETNPATPTPNHTFTKDSKVTVTVYVNLPGSSTPVAVPIGNCTFMVKFVPPPVVYTCNTLIATPGKVDDQGNQTYSFVINATIINATVKTYNIDFGDKSTPYSDSASSTTHVYAPGDYSATASVTVTTNTGVTATTPASSGCKAQISVPKPTPSTLVCNSLTPTPGNVDSTTGATDYTLAANATPTNATIVSYVFSLGDNGQTATVTTGATTATTTHTYAPGTYSVSVAVNGKDAAGNAITAPTNTNCAKSFTVKAPECKPGIPVGSPQCNAVQLTCVSLGAVPGAVDGTTGNTTYTFNAQGSVSSNGTITGYTFDFGDGNSTSVNSSDTTASTTHVYAPGNWSAKVTVEGTDASGNAISASSPKCVAQVPVKAPECKPGVPQGSNDCFTYTCNLLTVGKNDSRLVTITAFTASSTNPNATLKNVVIDWGDSTTPLTGMTNVVGQTHQYASTVNQATVTATAHFAITGQANSDIPATGTNCAQIVSFTTVAPPAPPAPTQLIDTGAGNVIEVFGVSAIIGTLGYRFFVSRRLTN